MVIIAELFATKALQLSLFKPICQTYNKRTNVAMGFLPDTQNYELRIRRECRERFSRHRLQKKTSS